MGGNEKIERAERFASRFEIGPNVGIVQGGFHRELGDPKQTQKRFQKASLLRMRPEVFLYSGPEFCGNDDWDAGASRVGQFVQTAFVAQHRDAGAGIEKKGRGHDEQGSELDDGTLVLFRTGRRTGKVCGIGKFFRKIASDFGEGPPFPFRHGLEHDLFAMLLDEHFGAFEAKGFREADGLAASVLEDFCCHIYSLYLRAPERSSRARAWNAGR